VTPSGAAPPQLTLRMNVTRPDVLPGEIVQYRIWIGNDSPMPAFDVQVRDTLDPALRLLRISSTQGAAEVEGQTLTLFLSVLDAGQTALAEIEVQVGLDAGAGQIILNQAEAAFRGGKCRSNTVPLGLPPAHLPATGAERR
jgi:uncharacterized repeat protein (TIGR01451 family)